MTCLVLTNLLHGLIHVHLGALDAAGLTHAAAAQRCTEGSGR